MPQCTITFNLRYISLQVSYTTGKLHYRYVIHETLYKHIKLKATCGTTGMENKMQNITLYVYCTTGTLHTVNGTFDNTFSEFLIVSDKGGRADIIWEEPLTLNIACFTNSTFHFHPKLKVC